MRMLVSGRSHQSEVVPSGLPEVSEQELHRKDPFRCGTTIGEEQNC